MGGVVGHGPADGLHGEIELVGYFVLGFAALKVLEDRRGADALDSWTPETAIRPAPHR